MIHAIETFAIKTPSGNYIIRSDFKTEYEVIEYASKLTGMELWSELMRRGYKVVKVAITEVE